MNAVECVSNGSVHIGTAATVQDTQSTYDVLLCHQAGNGGYNGLPIAPAKGSKDPLDGAADGSQDGEVNLFLRQHTELAVNYTEVSGEPYKDGGQGDDGTGLLDEGPAALPS